MGYILHTRGYTIFLTVRKINFGLHYVKVVLR